MGPSSMAEAGVAVVDKAIGVGVTVGTGVGVAVGVRVGVAVGVRVGVRVAARLDVVGAVGVLARLHARAVTSNRTIADEIESVIRSIECPFTS